MTAHVPARAAGGFILAAVALVAAGCGSEKPAGTVTGRVVYKGTPVTAGSVNFLSRTGAAAQAKLNEVGEFKVDGELEAGEYTVYASPPIPEPQPPGTKAPRPLKFTVPARYLDPASSPTTVTIKPGSNEIPVQFGD